MTGSTGRVSMVSMLLNATSTDKSYLNNQKTVDLEVAGVCRRKKTASPLPGFPSTSWPGKLRMRYIVRKHKLLIKGLALEIGVSCPEVESISTFTRNKCSRLEHLNSQINWSVVS